MPDVSTLETVKLTVQCPQCGKTSIKSLSELVGHYETACNRCPAVISLRDKVWRTAISKALKLAEEIKPSTLS